MRLTDRAMLAQVESFHAEIADGKASVSLKLMSFLKDWLSRHILQTDIEYSSHLSERLSGRRVTR